MKSKKALAWALTTLMIFCLFFSACGKEAAIKKENESVISEEKEANVAENLTSDNKEETEKNEEKQKKAEDVTTKTEEKPEQNKKLEKPKNEIREEPVLKTEEKEVVKESEIKSQPKNKQEVLPYEKGKTLLSDNSEMLNTEEKKFEGKAEEGKEEKLTCTLFISCENALKSGKLSDSLMKTLPNDGIIYAEQQVAFNEGESVFDILTAELKRCKIHMEFKNTPMYQTAYIEGIANLYEFDAGPLSGWMYRVNGEFPNYGCSGYKLKKGDKVEWVYTCDLGKDVGGEYAENNGG